MQREFRCYWWCYCEPLIDVSVLSMIPIALARSCFCIGIHARFVLYWGKQPVTVRESSCQWKDNDGLCKSPSVWCRPAYDKYWHCFEGNLRGTPERRGGARTSRSERYDAILNWNWNWNLWTTHSLSTAQLLLLVISAVLTTHKTLHVSSKICITAQSVHCNASRRQMNRSHLSDI